MPKSLWVAIAIILGASAGHAVDWTALRPQGYVSDFANVIDVSSKGQLEAYCEKVEASTKAQIALVTVPSLQGEPVEDVARTIGRAWGIGHKGENDGVLLLLAIADRKSRLEIGAGLTNVLSDSIASEVLREMRPALRQEHYGEALMAAAETLGTAITNARSVPAEAPMPRKERRSFWNSIPWPVIIGGVALLSWLLRFGGTQAGYSGWSGGGLLQSLLLGSLLSRSSWGSRGSGGFDGYDSGDSGGGGGFGGGDFGGGGASSDW